MTIRFHRTRRGAAALDASEREILAMTRDLDGIHHDESLPAMRSALDEWIAANHDRAREDGVEPSAGSGLATRVVSRRGLLVGAGTAAVGGLLVAACGSSTAARSTGTTMAGAGGAGASGGALGALRGDLAVAGLAASLENLGVYAYNVGINAARAGKLGSVPPAVVTFATTAMKQHQQHAAAWNAVLTGAGKPAVTATDQALTPTVNRQFAQVSDVAGLAKLALEIENVAAATYQSGIAALSSDKAVATAASIQPVELQHAAILQLVLGQYPVPNAFSPLADARSTTDLEG